ncbi:MAG TPA: hypothetical protein VGN14_11595 [Candidatus Elarobacter sp.]
MVAVFGVLLPAGAQTTPVPAATDSVDALNARLRTFLADLPAPAGSHAAATTMAETTPPTSTCRDGRGSGAARWLKYVAQGVDAFVVGAAIRHGAREQAGFISTSSSPVPFLVEFAAEDLLVDRALSGACTSVQNTAHFLLAFPALVNAANTRTTP